MKKCKVLFAVNAMNMGGLENFVMNIVRNIDLSRFYIEFLYCDNKVTYFDEEIEKLGLRITRITSRSESLKNHLKDLKEFFKHKQFDTVHINYNSSLCFTVARAAKKAGVRNIIVHSHNSYAKKAFFHKLCKPFVKKYANKYFACSQLAADWMFTKKINKSGEVTIINNAIDSERYCFSDKERYRIKQELGLQNKFIIGHVGRFNYQKNHKFLIDIFNEYLKINPDSVLLLLGNGELYNEIQTYVNDLSLTEKVVFAGIRDDIAEILSAIDCFLMPSLFEGLPVTLVEAQASGVRCLVSDTITKEVELTDAIEYFSIRKSAEEWAKQIKKNPKNRIEYNKKIKFSSFDIKIEVKELENFYSE